MTAGGELSERLIGAVERAAVAERVRAELDTATRELTATQWRIGRLTELAAQDEQNLRSLERPGWSRLVRFARGRLDEDLRVERADAEAARARLAEASGALEDAQMRVGLLTERLAEFAAAPDELAAALRDKEAWVHRQGDWRAGQLTGLLRRRTVIGRQITQIQEAGASLTATAAGLDELARTAQHAITVGALAGPNPLMEGVAELLAGSRTALDALWDALDAAPIRLGDLPPAPALPRVNLTVPEIVLGFSVTHLDLERLRSAALAQRRRLRAIEQRLRDEIAHREGLLAEVAGLRQRLLTLPDTPRGPEAGTGSVPLRPDGRRSEG